MLTALRRRLELARANPDAGITMTELIIAMALSTLLGAMTLSIFLTVNSSTSATTDRAIGTTSASLVMQQWPYYLKVSDGTTAGSISNRFEWLTANDMLFYADLYNRSATSIDTVGAPTMIWLRLDTAGSLVEEQFPSNAGAGTAPTTCRILTDPKKAPVTTARLFTAYDIGANSMGAYNLGTAPTVAAGCRPLPVTVPSRQSHPDAIASGNLQNVASVAIRFTVRDSKNLHPIEFNCVVTLPIPQPVQIPGT